MPITPYLDARTVDPEITRVMGVAFEMALAALRLSDRSDPLVASVARKIIALAGNSESNADRLCEQTLASLGIQQLREAAKDGGEAFHLRPRLADDVHDHRS
jgi:hypothetical protein